MLGRVYSFERDFTAAIPAGDASVSVTVSNAIRTATADQTGIRHEVLTDEENPRPIVAMLFSDASRMEDFDARIRAILGASAIGVSVVHTPDSAALGTGPCTATAAAMRAA